MRKDLKKNKKGFTLVEIIVVLLIIGILLAITIPSIMGYVGKAKEAQIQADARTGFVAAQTITAREVSTGDSATVDAEYLEGKINAKAVNDESGSNVISKAACTFKPDKTINECMFLVNGNTDKYVYFEAGSNGKAGDSKVSDGEDHADLKESVDKDTSLDAKK